MPNTAPSGEVRVHGNGHQPIAELPIQPHGRRITKPWGWEILWAETPTYCGKTLFIMAGRRLSLQYHDQKTETQCLIRGRAKLQIGERHGPVHEIEMEPGKGYTILPNHLHRIVAVEDTEIVEVSTPEIGTTYRLEDDYRRPNETEEIRRRPNRD
jgi:mannose-6-phosphate isomerase-like protein (cupin superfamily)